MKNIFLISFLLIFAGGELGRIQLTDYLSLYLHDFLIIAYLLFNFKQLKIIIKKIKKINKFNKKIFLLLFVNIFIAILINIWQKDFQFNSLLYLSRAIAYFLFILLLKKEFTNKKIFKLFLQASLILLLLGFLQYFFLPDLTSLYHLGFDDHFYRLTGTNFDPNYTGLIFALNWLYYLSQKPLKRKNLLLSFLFLIAIALTYSRATYLALLLAGGYLAFHSKKFQRSTIILSLFLLIFFIPFLPKKSGGEGVKLERTSSINARVSSAQQYAMQNQGLAILFGQGPFHPYYQRNREGLVSHARFADNFIIFLYNSFGVFGTCLIMILLQKEIKKKTVKNQHWQLSLLIALLTHGLFNNNLSQAFVSLIFWGFYL
jgi:hypothetical protein